MSESLSIEVVGNDGQSHPPAQLPSAGKLILGSDEDRASFVVSGQGVESVHCAIGKLKGGGWALKDLGSEFGTRVNGERVETARLKDGDEILLGSRKLRIYDPKKAAAPTKPDSAPVPSAAPTATKAAPSSQAKGASPASARKSAAKAKAPAGRTKSGETPQISGYRVDRKLGSGAMGNVFLSTQESLDRRVALKVLKERLARDEVFVQRFRDEARAAARLNHPNIVTVYDVGESAGVHFLSMEFMAGGSIEARLEELGPLPWREALDVIRDAAAGLVYAESRGIVHRDIKPENLMRNQDGVTKIADLGLAVQVEQEVVDSEEGKVFGTPHFLAPELARGAKADARSDLYSLGATAYRILSGRTPFEGETARDILRSALQDDLPPLEPLVPGLPPAFAATITRLLSKDPAGRHPSASVLLTELEALRLGGGSAPQVPGAGGGVPKGALIAGGVAIVVAAVGAMVLSGGGENENGEEDGGFRRTSDDTTALVAPEAAPEGGASGDGDGVNGESATDPANGEGAQGPTDTDATGTGPAAPLTGVEAEFEFQAQLAYEQLGDEALSPAQRASRLRELAGQFGGTDAANRALEEAAGIEAGSAAADAARGELEAKRETALLALRTAAALDTTPFHPGQALRAMRLVPLPEGLDVDATFVGGRTALLDEIFGLGLARGRTAIEAADAAEATGNLEGTRDPLRMFLTCTDLPTVEDAPVLLGEGAPPSYGEFTQLAKTVRTRLSGLEGKEDEFLAQSIARERSAIGRSLGQGLQEDLGALRLGDAAERVRAAAGMTRSDQLKAEYAERAADLDRAQGALETLLAAWDSPGWRRRTLTDPRPGASGNVQAVGVTTDAILIEGDGAPTRIPLTAWAGRTRALENLFKGRLDRDWTLDEDRGITALLSLSATLETLDLLSSSLAPGAMRVQAGAKNSLGKAIGDVNDWAERNAALGPLAAVHTKAVEALIAGLSARDEGSWAEAAEQIERLLDEQRSSWLVMILSDGGRR